MHIKLLATVTLAAAVMMGCAQEAVKQETKAAAKPKPALLTGASAKMLAETCEGCHGTGGNSMGPASPSIAGMSEDYLIEALTDYQSGDTRSTIMGRIMKGYTEDEIEKREFKKKVRIGLQEYKKLNYDIANIRPTYCLCCNLSIKKLLI